ncbi:MAG: hypothetical protein M1826_006658 [Phylliscum demangeonii]|nr:MAG: hypothetical protein M1826_006658 [Phylliscum demangeonii]
MPLSNIAAGAGAATSLSQDALRLQIKQRRFHLRALEITVTELQQAVAANPFPTPKGIPSIPAAGQRALPDQLLHALDQRQTTLLELKWAEVELELARLQQALGPDQLQPRCSHCVVVPSPADGQRPRPPAADRAWPVRKESLMPMSPLDSLLPLPLRLPGKPREPSPSPGTPPPPTPTPSMRRVVDRQVKRGLHHQRSVMSMVRRFRHRKPSLSPPPPPPIISWPCERPM